MKINKIYLVLFQIMILQVLSVPVFAEYQEEPENTSSEETDDTVETNENKVDEKDEDVTVIDKNKKVTESTTNIEPSKNEHDNNQILKPANEKQSQTKLVESNNELTPEEVELGMILNEINLSCDSSEFEYEMFYYDSMGPALTRLCKFEEAVNYYDKELGKESTNIEILTNKGAALSKLGLYDDAITQYDKVLKLNPAFIPALNNKANIYATIGNFDDATTLYNQVLQIDPTNISANKNLEKVNEKNSLYKETNVSISVFEEKTENIAEEKFESKQIINNYQDENNKKSDEVLDHISNMFSYITKVFSNIF
ncbi:MAG: tetratricopeptide repeat protein [Thaumarchaeota archaeon]|nr:tetratricopeptide repeat protein [Nitrososphaerota archaeon]